MLGEIKNQFSLTRAVLSTGGRAKSKFLSVQFNCRPGGGTVSHHRYTLGRTARQSDTLGPKALSRDQRRDTPIPCNHRTQQVAQSGVMHNIPDGEKWLWTPAQPDRQAKRQMIALQQLPELLRRVKELEKRLEAMGEPPAADPPPTS